MNDHRRQPPFMQNLAQEMLPYADRCIFSNFVEPIPRPTVVVVLPSPAGVGFIAVTRISFPLFLF